LILIPLLKIVDKLGLSFRTAKQLNELIDKLPGRPPFQRKELIIGNERLDFYCRDIVECIRSLYSDPQFAQDLAFAPERHYTSPDRTCRIYNEMYTGDWWWTVQVCVLWLNHYRD
jgi:Plavaka transposase